MTLTHDFIARVRRIDKIKEYADRTDGKEPIAIYCPTCDYQHDKDDTSTWHFQCPNCHGNLSWVAVTAKLLAELFSEAADASLSRIEA